MAKRKAYEEVLTTEFRWPQAGDVPFVISTDWRENAVLADDDRARLWRMIEGYRRAADVMVEASMADGYARDTLIYPIIFNYRQFLELALKHQIDTYGPHVGIEPIWRTHDLKKLWDKFLEVLNEYGTKDPDDADPIVGVIVIEFAKIDPGSFSFRYPKDTAGNPLPIPRDKFYLPHLTAIMEKVANYFTGCDGYLDHLKSSGPG